MDSHLLENTDATVAFGGRLAGALCPGDVVALVGTLGAGKTHLTKGIVLGLGSGAEVSSPTFTLVHEYVGGRLPVYHFDFYRLDHPRELLGIGWDEYVDSDGVVVAEWADKFPELLPLAAQWWRLAFTEDGKRRIERLPGPPLPSN